MDYQVRYLPTEGGKITFDFENSPVFLPDHHGEPCFFGGPLFICENENEFHGFYDSIETPFDVLRDEFQDE